MRCVCENLGEIQTNADSLLSRAASLRPSRPAAAFLVAVHIGRSTPGGTASASTPVLLSTTKRRRTRLSSDWPCQSASHVNGQSIFITSKCGGESRREKKPPEKVSKPAVDSAHNSVRLPGTQAPPDARPGVECPREGALAPRARLLPVAQPAPRVAARPVVDARDYHGAGGRKKPPSATTPNYSSERRAVRPGGPWPWARATFNGPPSKVPRSGNLGSQVEISTSTLHFLLERRANTQSMIHWSVGGDRTKKCVLEHAKRASVTQVAGPCNRRRMSSKSSNRKPSAVMRVRGISDIRGGEQNAIYIFYFRAVAIIRT